MNSLISDGSSWVPVWQELASLREKPLERSVRTFQEGLTEKTLSRVGNFLMGDHNILKDPRKRPCCLSVAECVSYSSCCCRCRCYCYCCCCCYYHHPQEEAFRLGLQGIQFHGLNNYLVLSLSSVQITTIIGLASPYQLQAIQINSLYNTYTFYPFYSFILFCLLCIQFIFWINPSLLLKGFWPLALAS